MLTKTVLKRVGLAALSGLTDAEIVADPAAAMRVAQGAMRGALAGAGPLGSVPDAEVELPRCDRLVTDDPPPEDFSHRWALGQTRPAGRHMKATLAQVSAAAKPLSATMVACIDMARDAGGELVRYQGGFWAPRGYGYPPAQHVAYHGTSTVQAVVDRGWAEYTEWRDGRGGRFPIAMKLKAEEDDGNGDG